MINSKELLRHTQNLSILFAEDDEAFRVTIEQILKKFFHTVVVVKNGQEALDAFRQYFHQENKYFDLVLSDICMPKINGIDLTSGLYALNPDQAVVILSAHEESKYLLPLINLGVKQYIKKPLDYQDFLHSLLGICKTLSHQQSAPAESSTQILFKDFFAFDKKTDTLFQNSQAIYLTKYEIFFMRLLTSKIGKIYTNEEISSYYEQMGENFNEVNIRKLVSKLRKKLPQKTIESVYGIGYKIISEL